MVTLQWNETESASAYNVYWSTANPITNGTTLFPNKIPNAGLTKYVHANLQYGYTYYYAVVASNSKGESGYSNIANTTISSLGPKVISTYPAPNETEVPLCIMDRNTFPIIISAQFDSILPSPKPTLTVVDNLGNQILFTDISGNNDSKVQYTLPAGTLLNYDRIYTVNVAGNVSGNPYSWRFATVKNAPEMSMTNTGNDLVITWTSVPGATSYNLMIGYWSAVFDPRTGGVSNVTSPYKLTQPVNGETYPRTIYYVVAMKGSSPISYSNSLSFAAN
jgi:hypothetical protein